MIKLRVLIILLFFLQIFIIGTPLFASEDNKIVTSAEKIVEKWAAILPEFASYSVVGGKYYQANRLRYEPDTLSYDVKKTDSLVSPYKLILSGGVLFDYNRYSPNATNVWKGSPCQFNTKEEALLHTKPIDFANAEPRRVAQFTAVYALQKGKWVFNSGIEIGEKGGNEIEKFIRANHKELLEIPVE